MKWKKHKLKFKGRTLKMSQGTGIAILSNWNRSTSTLYILYSPVAWTTPPACRSWRSCWPWARTRSSRGSLWARRDQLCKIGLPGKSILGDYFQENMTSRRRFLLQRISFPGRPIFTQLPAGRPRPRAPPRRRAAGQTSFF